MDTYEKKYKNALTIAQSRFKIEKDESVLTCLGMIFPELRESEDEMIRKWLVDYFGSVKEVVLIHRDITCEQILEWLEKQKPEYPLTPDECIKPAEWSEEDEKIMQTMIKEGDLKPSEIAWLKSLRPSWRPSEEQMLALNDAKNYLIAYCQPNIAKVLSELEEQLEKL